MSHIDKLSTRECEIKCRLLLGEYRHFSELLVKRGFASEGRRTELDYVPDVENFLCRQHKLLLRFREVTWETGARDILLTLKMKFSESTFKDNVELQYYFSKPNEEMLAAINVVLEPAIGVRLSAALHQEKSVPAIKEAIVQLGFTRVRAYLEKKREAFHRGTDEVTLDVFPEDVGDYLEIESRTPEGLETIIALLAIPADRLDKRDYGDIVKAHKLAKGCSEEEARRATF